LFGVADYRAALHALGALANAFQRPEYAFDFVFL